MDFYRMECFLTAAETGSIRKAADKMCMTQPAMSFQIRELERELQLTLFERDYSGVHLTEPGKIVQAGFMQILDSYRKVLDKALTCAYGKGRIAVGYHGFINWAGIHTFMADFSRRHPDIEVSITQQQMKELADDLELGTLDVAFLEEAELRSRGSLSSLALFQEKTCFAIPREHPLAAKEKITVADLENETILMNNHPSDSMGTLIENLERSGIRREQFRFVGQPDIALALTVAGQGLTSLPMSFRQEGLPLRYVEYDTPVCRMSYMMAWRSDTTNPVVRLFCTEASMVSWPYAGA